VFRDLSDRLNLSRDEGEKWIVNLIRETRMGADAKIDLKQVRVLLPSLVSVFQLFDVIPNAQTLANKERPGRVPSLVPVWVWHWKSLALWESAPGSTDTCDPVFVHCLAHFGLLLVGLRFDWVAR
jgi:hypothetical protein